MNPFFVIGAWHSGTRLPAQILGTSMPVLSQSSSLDCDSNEIKRIIRNILSRKLQYTNKDVKKFRKSLEKCAQKYNVSASNFVCKLPMFSYVGGFLRDCYPSSPIINIIRNGLDVSVSDLGLPVPTRADSPKQIAFHYAYFNEIRDKFCGINLKTIPGMLKKRPPEKHLFAAQLWKNATIHSIKNRQLSKYYELKFENIVESPYIVSKNFLTSLQLDYNVEKLKKWSQKIDSTKVNRWKKVYNKRQHNQLLKLIKKDLIYLKYEV